MEKDNATAGSTANREVIISRLLNAPRELVFTVWTQPEHLEKWWGPNGFTTTLQNMDVRVGGKLEFMMFGMGLAFPNVIVYKEVVKPERLVYSHGNGKENDPGEFEVTVTFDDEGGKTRLTMHSVFKTAEARNFVVNEYGAIERGNETVDHLEEYLRQL